MRKLLVPVILIAVCFLTVGRLSAQKSEYKLQPTDVLAISVHGNPDLTTKTRVMADGSISFPLIGKVAAAGLTVQELEQKIRTLLEAKYLVTAEVLVFIEEYNPRQVSVMGEVKNPGKYSTPEEKDLTVMQAIAMAGGLTNLADPTKTKVMRKEDGKEKTIVINTKDITLRGEKDKDIIMKPEDIVFVPLLGQVSVMGEVRNPGKCDIPGEKRLTLMQAIAMAGGFTKHANISNTRVMRISGGEKQTITVDVRQITEKGDKDKDIDLEPDDIVFVPESFF